MSPDTPEDVPRGRLIVPGEEPGEPRDDKPRLIVPGEERTEAPAEPPAEAARDRRQLSRIVLPPGVSRDTPEDLPEFPKIRPLVIVPIRDGQREMLLVSDPVGVVRGSPVLGIEALPLLQLMDGTVSLTDLTAALMRESKDLRVANMVRDFVAQLDELLLLDSPRFARAYRELQGAYHPLEIRPAALEGRAYPAEREELTRFLAAHFAEAEAWRATAGEPVRAQDSLPRALMAPHLDPRRSGASIARAVMELPAEPRSLRVVIFGTGHQLVEDSLALTRKHFETPLGRVQCDTRFVDAVASKLGEAAYRSELCHRDEHSIEFAVLYLRHFLGERPFTIVPILCGGFHALVDGGRKPSDDAAFEGLIGAVRDAARDQGGRTIYLAAVDLSHVGPRFGDPRLDERAKSEVERLDRQALAAAVAGDAEGWFEAIAAHGDATRICGFAPMYATLRCAGPGAGRLLRYAQSDEADTSMVSIASAVWD